jgi:hypothetical protein
VAGGPPAGGKPPPATPSAAPAETVSPPATTPGSSLAPVGLRAAVIEGADGDESSTDSFCWCGDEEVLEFKSNNAIPLYLPTGLCLLPFMLSGLSRSPCPFGFIHSALMFCFRVNPIW